MGSMAPEEDRRFELTTSLSVSGGSPETLDDYVARFDKCMAANIRQVPTITAYFAAADKAAFEIVVGLRFEGMPPRNIEGVARKVIDDTIQQLAEGAAPTGPAPVREESTLVPA